MYIYNSQAVIHKLSINSQVTWLVVTEVWSESFGLVTERRYYNGQAGYWAPSLKRCHVPSTFTTMHIIRCNAFSLFSVVLHAFPELCVYYKFGHHSHPLGYPCAKFRFFRSLLRWASPWRQTAYSITHSPSLYDAPGSKAFALEKNIYYYEVCHH